MTQSSFADVLDAIYDTINTSNTSGSLASYPAGAYRIAVYDGPPIDDRSAVVEIRVGVTGDTYDEIAADIAQEWASFGADGDRDETIDVPCVIWVRQGSNDMRTWRRVTSDVLNIVAGLFAGGTLGLTKVFAADVTVGELREIQAVDGAALVLQFVVRCECTLP